MIGGWRSSWGGILMAGMVACARTAPPVRDPGRASSPAEDAPQASPPDGGPQASPLNAPPDDALDDALIDAGPPADARGSGAPSDPLDSGPPPADGGASALADGGTVEAGWADAGGDAGPPPDPALAESRSLARVPADTVQLATDGLTVYGITARNEVWALDPGQSRVRVLVAGGGEVPDSNRAGVLVLADAQLFWLDRFHGGLHRTPADGQGDETLVEALAAPGALAVDQNSVYWTEATFQGEGGGVIRALPRDATAGAAPATLLEVGNLIGLSSLAAENGTLYWTPFNAIGATVYFASVWSAAVTDLVAGGQGTSIDGAAAYWLMPTSAGLYFAYKKDIWTTAIGRRNSNSATTDLVTILPIGVGVSGLAITGGWLVVTDASSGGLGLSVAPTQGAGLVQIASALQTPAIGFGAGVVFVDGAGDLLFLPEHAFEVATFGP